MTPMLPGRPGVAPWLRQHRVAVAAMALLVLHATVCWRSRAFGIPSGNDEATYLLLARALRQLRYQDFFLVGAPAHAQYPPGFPAFLALLITLFGEHVDALLAAIVLVSTATLGFLFAVMRRCFGSGAALVALIVTALNPDVIAYGGQLMSEALYALFATVALWAIVSESRADQPGHSQSRWTVIAATSAICAAMTRTIGVTLIAAILVYWLARRYFRRAAAFAVASSLTVGAWLLWTVVAPARPTGRSYVSDAVFQAGAKRSFIVELVSRIATNVPAYMTESLPWLLPQPTISGTLIDNVVGLLVTIGLLAAGVWMLWRGGRILVLYLAMYGALLAVWPWNVPRFLSPILPLILCALVLGALELARRRAWLRPVGWIAGALVLLTALSEDARRLSRTNQCDRSKATVAAGCFEDIERSFFAIARYAGNVLPRQTVVLTVKEAVFAYYSGLKTEVYYALDGRGAPEMFEDMRRRGIEYIALTPLREREVQRLPFLQQNCSRLIVIRKAEPATVLLRVLPRDSTSTENACEAIRAFDRAYPALRDAFHAAGSVGASTEPERRRTNDRSVAARSAAGNRSQAPRSSAAPSATFIAAPPTPRGTSRPATIARLSDARR